MTQGDGVQKSGGVPQRVDGFTRLLEVEVERRPVFVRADLDAPVAPDGTLLDDSKIVEAVPTLRWLLDREAQVVVGAHRQRRDAAAGGAPPESAEPESLEPCAARLAELLDTEVYLPDQSTGLLAKKLRTELRPGRLLVLENLLRDPREATGDPALGRALSEGIEVYVGDCLAGREELSSLVSLPRFVRERAIGLRLEQELVHANRLRHAWEQGLVLLLGGTFGERCALLDHALSHPRAVVVPMGELGSQLVRASAGADPLDSSELAEARSWLAKANARNLTLELGLGGQAVHRACERLGRARATLCLGARHAASDRDDALLASAVQGTGLLVVVHDLETPARALLDQPQRSRSVFVSTGGDALERLLCEQKLPGVEALRRVA